jgi:hypothetical protein
MGQEAPGGPGAGRRQEAPGTPGSARKRQEAPGSARRRQEAPGGARRRHEEPGGARRRQDVPGSASRPQEAPGSARKRQEAPGGARRCGGDQDARTKKPGAMEMVGSGWIWADLDRSGWTTQIQGHKLENHKRMESEKIIKIVCV